MIEHYSFVYPLSVCYPRNGYDTNLCV